jgi:hypothetical protein
MIWVWRAFLGGVLLVLELDPDLPVFIDPCQDGCGSTSR